MTSKVKALLRLTPRLQALETIERVRIVRYATARRMALRVNPSRGEICLVIPKRGSERAAWKFAHENRDWIDRHLDQMEIPVPFASGAKFPIFGIERTLHIHKGTSRVTECVLNAGTLDVYTTREDPASNIKDFLYKMLLDHITPLAHDKAARSKRKVKSISLRNTRARWGSCRTDGQMMFCWRLVFADPVIIDYVVGHEVAHLTHMDHSPKFWKLCDELSEKMDYSRDWLIVYGDRLLSYGSPL